MEVVEIKEMLEKNEEIKRYYVSIIGCKYQCIKKNEGKEVEDFELFRLVNQLMYLDVDILDKIMDIFSKAIETDELSKKVEDLEKKIESLNS